MIVSLVHRRHKVADGGALTIRRSEEKQAEDEGPLTDHCLRCELEVKVCEGD